MLTMNFVSTERKKENYVISISKRRVTYFIESHFIEFHIFSMHFDKYSMENYFLQAVSSIVIL